MDIDSHLVVGRHEGIHQWTVGQRCRLHSFLKPYYVARKDISTNTIYVASGHEHPALYANKIITSNANIFSPDVFKHLKDKELRCRFRFQHTKPLVDCTIFRESTDNKDELIVLLDKQLRAVTPGQYAVFYSGTECLGSARIVTAMHTTNQTIESKEIFANS